MINLSSLDIFKDPKFIFDEPSHRYTYEGDQFISVTTFLHHFKSEFDADKWAQIKADQEGITKEEMLARWKEKSDNSCILGTKVHSYIEYFYNGENPVKPTEKDVLSRVDKFHRVHESRLHKLTPLAQELRVFSKKWKIAGTIDALFYKGDFLYVLDWKTNGLFKTANHPKGCYQKLKYPFDDMYDNEHSLYSLQLSLYRLILEEYGIETHDSFLIHIGPDDEAQVYKAMDVRDKLKKYLNEEHGK